MVGMITNISDRKNTSFLSIDKALFNKNKVSSLKNGVILYFEWHFHELLERCSIILRMSDGTVRKVMVK